MYSQQQSCEVWSNSFTSESWIPPKRQNFHLQKGNPWTRQIKPNQTIEPDRKVKNGSETSSGIRFDYKGLDRSIWKKSEETTASGYSVLRFGGWCVERGISVWTRWHLQHQWSNKQSSSWIGMFCLMVPLLLSQVLQSESCKVNQERECDHLTTRVTLFDLTFTISAASASRANSNIIRYLCKYSSPIFWPLLQTRPLSSMYQATLTCCLSTAVSWAVYQQHPSIMKTTSKPQPPFSTEWKSCEYSTLKV